MWGRILSSLTLLGAVAAFASPPGVIENPCAVALADRQTSARQIDAAIPSALAAEWPDLPPISLRDLPAEKFVAPLGHDPGTDKIEIYRVEHPEGAGILKVISLRSRQTDIEDARDELRGVRLGALFGGPRVLRAGRIRLEKGDIGLFIELEQISPHDPGITWKGAFVHDPGFDLSKLNRSEPRSERLSRKLARAWVKLLEHRVAPSDLDFIYADGALRWIDTKYWRAFEADVDPWLQHYFGPFWGAVNKAAYFFPDFAASFLIDFADELQASTRVPEDIRDELAAQLLHQTFSRQGFLPFGKLVSKLLPALVAEEPTLAGKSAEEALAWIAARIRGGASR